MRNKGQKKPELLAPAKNLERLKVAIRYGADAVYLSGQRYGLRARADNFSDDDIIQAVDFAHKNDAKIYITLNAFLHDEDMEGLEEYAHFLEGVGVDAVIVSDLGVLEKVKRSSQLEIHLSTQASCLNGHAALFWKKAGVKRVILGREVSIIEAGRIKEKAGIDVELFIHGAMCVAFSGHCAISNFTAGRDSNRGGCSQSCRHPYLILPVKRANYGNGDNVHREIRWKNPLKTLTSEELFKTFLSSKDLMGLRQIPAFFSEGISSLKIEGRMKSSLYVATTCKVYRQAIDAYWEGNFNASLLAKLEEDLKAIPHRAYFSGALEGPLREDSTYEQRIFDEEKLHKYQGIILDTTKEYLIVRLYETLQLGDLLEFLPFQGDNIRWQVDEMFDIEGHRIHFARNDSVIFLPKKEELKALKRFNVLRKEPVNSAPNKNDNN